MKTVVIYTDGACSGNPGKGGWAAVLNYQGHTKQISGGEDPTTNNRMELTAVIRALQELKESCEIDLFTDSQYVANGFQQWLPNWKKKNWKTAANKPVANADLWQQLESEVARHTLHWHWLKGHAGDTNNELVDSLARQEITKKELDFNKDSL